MTRALQFYKRFVSPILTSLLRARGLEGQCKFHPTCSEYAAGAFELHGPAKGALLTVWRLLRCHPFSSGGVDLVPAPDHTFETIR